MGMMASRLNAYSSKFMMSTTGYVHFAEDMRRQQAQAAGAQQLVTVSQMQAAGTGGGGGGSGGPVPGVGWFHFGQTLTAFAPYAVIIGGALSGVAYAFKAQQYMLFLSLFVAAFFGMFFVLFHTQATMTGTLSGKNFWIALAGAALIAFPVAFFVYKGPDEDKNDSGNPQQVVYVPGGSPTGNTPRSGGGSSGLPPI